jgi:hypothetical protein
MSDKYFHLGTCPGCGGTGHIDDPISTGDREQDERRQLAAAISDTERMPGDVKQEWVHVVLTGDAKAIGELKEIVDMYAEWESDDAYLSFKYRSISAGLSMLSSRI